MERFIIRYNNGKVRQQRGLNITYHYMLCIGVISWIIDTKTGEIEYPTQDEGTYKEKISSYSCSDMVTPKD